MLTEFPPVNVCLEDVSPVLSVNDAIYGLRWVCSHRHGMSKLRNAIGHYQSYCKRDQANYWEFYDDLKSKSIPVKSNT